jgi:hypothetical protein
MAADCRIGSINDQGPALPARRGRVLAPLRAAGRRQQTGVDLLVTVLHEAVSLGELPHQCNSRRLARRLTQIPQD